MHAFHKKNGPNFKMIRTGQISKYLFHPFIKGNQIIGIEQVINSNASRADLIVKEDTIIRIREELKYIHNKN